MREKARASGRTTLDLITAEETDPGTTALRVSEERDDWGLYGVYRFYCTVCKPRDEWQKGILRLESHTQQYSLRNEYNRNKLY